MLRNLECGCCCCCFSVYPFWVHFGRILCTYVLSSCDAKLVYNPSLDDTSKALHTFCDTPLTPLPPKFDNARTVRILVKALILCLPSSDYPLLSVRARYSKGSFAGLDGVFRPRSNTVDHELQPLVFQRALFCASRFQFLYVRTKSMLDLT